MAAGRQNNFSRKRYSEETLSYKNRYNQRSSDNDPDHRNNTEHTRSSGGRIHDHRRNNYREADLRKEDAVSENWSRADTTKKRKFSPILWDRSEKQVKIESKNGAPPTNSILTRSSPLESSKDIVRDLKIEKCSVAVDSDLQISPVESIVSSVSDGVAVSTSLTTVTATPQEHDQEIENEDGEYMEEQEYVEVRNLSKSKWAFKDSPRMNLDSNNSSPESGEFKRESFKEENDEVSSLSDEADVQSEDAEEKFASGYVSSEGDNDDHRGVTPCCRNVFEYERLGKISEGTYGVVYKARDKKTGEIVALKKVKMGKEREGFPVTALREINILGSFKHPSVVEVKEVVMDDFDGVYMVMEFIDNELKGYMDRMKQPFSQSEVKCLMLQLLEGLSYLHDNWVIHRDLKTSNLLLDNNGELKICDFGMARQYGSPVKPYTSLVVTLWYRAPEVLLGMKNYTTAIDMWSVGCIMAELLSKKPLFDGGRELEQIDKIFRTLGTPNDSIWPGYSKLPGVKSSFVKQPCNTLRKKFPVATFTGAPVLTELGFDLLNKLLTYDPSKRITAEEALNHGWFREAPLPAEHVRMCR